MIKAQVVGSGTPPAGAPFPIPALNTYELIPAFGVVGSFEITGSAKAVEVLA